MLDSWVKVGRGIVRAALEKVRTATTSRVDAVAPGGSTVDVTPLVNEQVSTESQRLSLGATPLLEVPVVWYGTNTGSLSMPLSEGDQVLLVQRGGDHSNVEQGVPVPHDPPTARRFNPGDAVALPTPAVGSWTADRYSEQHVVLYVVAGSELKLGSAQASEALALASSVRAELQQLKQYLDTHTHLVPGVTPGPGSTTSDTPLTPAPTPGDVGSTRVKVDA